MLGWRFTSSVEEESEPWPCNLDDASKSSALQRSMTAVWPLWQYQRFHRLISITVFSPVSMSRNPSQSVLCMLSKSIRSLVVHLWPWKNSCTSLGVPNRSVCSPIDASFFSESANWVWFWPMHGFEELHICIVLFIIVSSWFDVVSPRTCTPGRLWSTLARWGVARRCHWLSVSEPDGEILLRLTSQS